MWQRMGEVGARARGHCVDLVIDRLSASPPRRPQALITVFTLITGEDWNEAMASAMVAGPTVVVPYFCLVYSIGNYLLVSLCVAVVTAGWGATKQLQQTEAVVMQGELEGSSSPVEDLSSAEAGNDKQHRLAELYQRTAELIETH